MMLKISLREEEPAEVQARAVAEVPVAAAGAVAVVQDCKIVSGEVSNSKC
jgi:hypothetical protein